MIYIGKGHSGRFSYPNEDSIEMDIIDKLEEENKDLKSQLANIKYLNADEVEDHIKEILAIVFGNWVGEDNDEPNDEIPMQIWDKYETELQNEIQVICNLAIPDIDRDKIIKILHEFVVYQIEADNLIHNEAVEYVADEIIKAIRGEE